MAAILPVTLDGEIDMKGMVEVLMFLLSWPLVVAGFFAGLLYPPVGVGFRLGTRAMRWLMAYTSRK